VTEGPKTLPIQAIRQAITQNNGKALAEGLESLFAASPERWRAEIALKARWPHPNGGEEHLKFREALILAFKQLDESGAPAEILELLFAWQDFNARYVLFRRALRRLEFVGVPIETQIWRLCGFLEHQFFYVLSQNFAGREKEEIYDPLSLLHPEVTPLPGGAQVSLLDVIESQADSLDLILRLLLRTSPPIGAPESFIPLSPFHDPEFSQLFNYAGYWKLLDYLWECILYRGWRARLAPSRLVLEPEDVGAFIRREALFQREILFPAELMGHLSGIIRATPERPHLVSTVKLPEPGKVWDCELDTSILRQLLSRRPSKLLAGAYIQERHYGSIVEHLKIGNEEEINWPTWQEARVFLEILGELVRDSTLRQGRNPASAEGCLAAVILTSRTSLANSLAETTGWELSKSSAVLDTLLFDPKRRGLDIYVQPLIPMGGDLVFLVPALVSSHNPVRALEGLIKVYAPEGLMDRGRAFEDALAESIREILGVPVATRIKALDKKKNWVEFDLLFYWQGELFLLESKCLYSISGPYDEFRAWHAVEQGVAQLETRRGVLTEVWDQIVERYPQGFPADCPRTVHLIAVSNLLCFSGLSVGEVIIADDLSLLRYFHSRTLHLQSFTEGSSSTLSERELFAEERSPESFCRYLRELPQFRFLLEKTTSAISKLPEIAPGLVEIEFPRLQLRTAATDPFVNASG